MSTVLEWLEKNDIMRQVLRSNLHHKQYVDQVEKIMRFLLQERRLSEEHLDAIWAATEKPDQFEAVKNNIFDLLADLAWSFSPEQLDSLFGRFERSQGRPAADIVKILQLIKKLARSDTKGVMATRLLELLWKMMHSGEASAEVLESNALTEILGHYHSVNCANKNVYIERCLKMLELGDSVIPSLRLLREIILLFAEKEFYPDDISRSTLLRDLDSKCNLLSLVVDDFSKYVEFARSLPPGLAAASTMTERAKPLLVDGRYSHEEHVHERLRFLLFALQAGEMNMPWSTTEKLWNCMVESPACSADRERGLEWFYKAMEEWPVIAPEAAGKLLVQKFTAMDPATLTLIAYRCYTRLFVWVNINEKKLRKLRNEEGHITLGLDLVGLPYMWRFALSSPILEIAKESSMLLRDIHFSLSETLQENMVAVRQHFIDECFCRLRAALDSGLLKCCQDDADSVSMASCSTAVDGSVGFINDDAKGGKGNAGSVDKDCRGGNLLETDVEAMDAVTVERSHDQSPAKSLQEARQAQRCLHLLQIFILKCEGRCPRKVPAHGAFFQGRPFVLDVSTAANKQSTRFQVEVNENEYLSSLRLKVAKRLEVSASRVRLTYQGRELTQDSQVLGQCNLLEGHTVSASVTLVDRTPEPMDEEELPGILISKLPKVYDTLFQLSDVVDDSVREAAKSLLMLLPTHPGILADFQELGDATSAVEAGELFTRHFSARSRLVYTFQVLDGILMPVNRTERSYTHKFRRNFVRFGGFPYLLAVFQPGSLESGVDDHTRRSCYSSSLRLMKLLLLGDLSAPALDEGLIDTNATCLIRADGSVMEEGKEEITEDVVVSMSETSNGAIEPHASCSTGNGVKCEPVDMEEVVHSLTRLVWATATGNISAMGNSGTVFGLSRKVEELDSKKAFQLEDEEERTNNVDIYLCTEAMELLLWCLLKQKPLLMNFVNMPTLSQFIVDIVLYSSCEFLRIRTAEFLLKLSEVTAGRGNKERLAHRQILVALLSSKEQANQQPRRCNAFFELLARSINGIQGQEERLMAQVLLLDEVEWLKNAPAAIDDNDKLLEGHLGLIHRLVEVIDCSVIGSSRLQNGTGLIEQLVKVFLFPESTLLIANREEGQSPSGTGPMAASGIRFGYIGGSLADNGFLQAKCSTRLSRLAAFRLLLGLCQNHLDNTQEMVDLLLRINLTVEICDWEHLPSYGRKPVGGYVGLRNAGATCYMNSVFQQLYMQPEVRRSVLACEECSEHEQKDSLFFQVQAMFGALLGSSLDHYTPQGFWQAYRDIDDQPVNLREHQDAFEFFTRLYDTVDETLKGERREPTLTRIYGGTFAQQVICRGCPHRSEREDNFAAISVDVKNKRDLVESLESFVRGDLLEADNAYHCETCNTKVDALKRVCVKTLPHSLIIHLKRFDFDYESMQRLKLKDRFEFPIHLNMKPFTVEGLAEKDQLASEKLFTEQQMITEVIAGEGSTETDPINAGQGRSVDIQTKPDSYYQYELVGVVVHSGTAFAGHYYSYIKERDGDKPLDSPDDQVGSRWISFDDKRVELYEAADLEKDCFGGKYTVDVYDNFLKTTAPQEFDRPNSAYMLLYERVSSPGSRESLSPQDSPSVTGASDFKGEEEEPEEFMKEMQRVARKTATYDKCVQMPASIHRSVWEENLRFVHENHLLDKDYFRFLYKLVDMNLPMMEGRVRIPRSSVDEQGRRGGRGGRNGEGGSRRSEDSIPSEFARLATQLTTDFLFRVYLRTHGSLREDLQLWKNLIWRLFDANAHAFKGFLQMVAVEHPSWVKQFLLKCPIEEVRQTFAQILLQAILSAVQYMRGNYLFQDNSNRPHDLFHLDALMQLLIHPLQENNIAKCFLTQYFMIFVEYARLGQVQRYHLTRCNCISLMILLVIKMVRFLPQSNGNLGHRGIMTTRLMVPLTHKFEISLLHSTLSLLVRGCVLPRPQEATGGVESMVVEDGGDDGGNRQAASSSSSQQSTPQQTAIGPNPYALGQVQVLPQDAEELLFEEHAYISIIVETCPEHEDSIKLLEYCSWENQKFSLDVIKLVLSAMDRAVTSELKPLSALLLRLLQIKDSLQQARQEFALVGNESGMVEDGAAVCGMMDLILKKQVNHNKRYALLKFVVRLIHTLPQVRNLLQQYKTDWKKAVDWLSEEITNGSSSPINNSPLSNEDTTSGYLQRTNTAEWTLNNARNLLSP
eukprot:TRINITY_DN429_c0_g2_i1.p1 TRINITY_DN429_c0_g2~~TRINITY_DN429_c0_g2_i1.p1  ORF type:complete len:2250 (-),score=350.03 TRINITY_DN429_c0_g2_i1:694-7287(-)